MREILFKAKRMDNGEWVEGYVFDDGIIDSQRMFVGGLVITDYKGKADDRWNVGTNFYEVIPETVSQYTGLTDKNGVKIWENDICDRKERFPEIVKMQNGDWTLDYGYAFGKEDCYCSLGFYVLERESVEVIGNIFDNPELLEVADE